MQTKYIFLPALLAITCLSGMSQASESPPSASTSAGITVGELSAVQSETFLYKAKADRARAIRSIDGDNPQTSASPATAYQPRPFAPDQLGSGSGEQLPVVKLVSGSSRALRATLLYSGGYEVDAQRSGQELPDGYKVESISLDSVILSRAGKRYPLGFSSRAPSASVQDSARMPVPGLPGMLMGQPSPVTLSGQH
ncbi:type IV pilus biogenesis protein PilP [Pseudomonas gingeri NCPPB 3146 = LMG 5327]|uniref:Type IV pilus biogenesis protein PilP n=2 Tax=Pseudomonas gingeri TaxID=117681 RepID=A0A7Y7Y228_9PSED|nr:type IV pilus biogenesis protein PilP [Pseudomonas gingeri]NWC16509.1 type IV pilus biogenesis protein PilP [Pseudomonas gingeri]PNQ91130.1 type IV pilus biogenesis protein PilP [Pseudomonas gingeri NCPPB 3146 = LMG 5327]